MSGFFLMHKIKISGNTAHNADQKHTQYHRADNVYQKHLTPDFVSLIANIEKFSEVHFENSSGAFSKSRNIGFSDKSTNTKKKNNYNQKI